MTAITLINLGHLSRQAIQSNHWPTGYSVGFVMIQLIVITLQQHHKKLILAKQKWQDLSDDRVVPLLDAVREAT